LVIGLAVYINQLQRTGSGFQEPSKKTKTKKKKSKRINFVQKLDSPFFVAPLVI